MLLGREFIGSCDVLLQLKGSKFFSLEMGDIPDLASIDAHGQFIAENIVQRVCAI